MTTRRRFLAGAGTATVAGLAGCTALRWRRDDQGPSVDPSEFQDGLASLPATSSPLPVSVPDSLVDRHRTRARELFESVPVDPSIPNGVVAREVREHREHVRERLETGSDATFGVDVLRDWRYARGDAANLRGAYRAATGEDDGAVVKDRRSTVREDLGAFTADLEYRATDPVEAVLIYATIEDLLEDARRGARPDRPYPESPVDAVEQAGYAVEAVEDAAASLADARAIRERYLGARETTESQWATLIEATHPLAYASDRTLDTLEEYQEYDPSAVFDRDVSRLEDRLFRIASRRVQSSEGSIREYRYRGDGAFATAVLAAGRNLAAMAVYRSVHDAIENGALDDAVTAATIRSRASAARSAFGGLEDADHPHLSVAIARAAMGSYGEAERYVDERNFEPEDAEAALRYATMFARVAPRAAEYLVDRLQSVAE